MQRESPQLDDPVIVVEDDGLPAPGQRQQRADSVVGVLCEALRGHGLALGEQAVLSDGEALRALVGDRYRIGDRVGEAGEVVAPGWRRVWRAAGYGGAGLVS